MKYIEQYWLVRVKRGLVERDRGVLAYILNTSDLKHDSKLTIGVMYAFSNRWLWH